MTDVQRANRVIVVGILDPTRRRQQHVAVTEHRSQLGGRVNQFNLQLDTPYGEPYRITVSTGVQTEGTELLSQERIGQPLVVEGLLQTRLITDSRYAVKESDAGRTARELHVRATLLREPRADEPVGQSAVWLSGVVLTTPRFGHHRTATALEMARTVVRVQWSRPSGYPGSQAQITEEADINISVPVAMANAAYVLTPGNRLQIEGQLDCVLIPLRGPVVEARLKELSRTWEEAKQRASSHDALQAGLRDYRRQRERLSQTAVLAEVPGVITPQPGAQLGDLESARAADRQRLEAGREAPRERPIPRVTPAPVVSAPPEQAEQEASANPAPALPASQGRPRRRTPEGDVSSASGGWVGEEV